MLIDLVVCLIQDSLILDQLWSTLVPMTRSLVMLIIFKEEWTATLLDC